MVRKAGYALVVALAGVGSLAVPSVRQEVRALVRPEPPAQITPLALHLPTPATATAETPSSTPTAPPTATITTTPAASATVGEVSEVRGWSDPEARPSPTRRAASPTPRPSATVQPTPRPSATARPTPSPVTINGRVYDAYVPAASKKQQAYQYSCEFDAAWVILQTYGFEPNVDKLIEIVGVDPSIEPYIKETPQGFVIHGGDITSAFSGDYKKNFLARSSGAAVRKAFEHYGLQARPVNDRAGVEAALRGGALVWIKTTVDFKPWKPATWRMPDGRTKQTVLGNDHAVVVIGYNAQGVVIRDVLGPTSSNRKRPYEYEVEWSRFLAAWGAQEYDGLAVDPPRGAKR